MRWIVERAAEQRLLWHLRTATAATLEAPDDLAADEALAILKRGLKRDADRHLRWFLVNAAALLVSVALILVPGPERPRLLLHVHHRRPPAGVARRRPGPASASTWQVASSPVVAELRAALVLDLARARARVHAVAERLGLQHLATFFERLAVPAA